MLHTIFFSATVSNPMFRKLGYSFCLLIGSAFLLAGCSYFDNERHPKPDKDANVNIFMTSTIDLDLATDNITLPIFKGQHDGETVWYIVTESSDEENAEMLGVNFSPKLANALGTAAVQDVRFIDENTGTLAPSSAGILSHGVALDFEGTVDFSPERIVVSDPENGFPPIQFQAGAVGDNEYSPLVNCNDGIVLNASQVANESGIHDAIVDIDYKKRQVTLDQFRGFYEFEEVLYLHQEGSIELVAAVEGSTWAPNLNAAPGLASNHPETTARSAIIPILNGERGKNNPHRQGLESALLGEGDPFNVTQEEPGFEDGEVLYSPMWDLHLVVWTEEAIAAGERRKMTDADEIAEAFEGGLLVSGTPNSGEGNSSLMGMEALGAISNCPMTVNLGMVE